MVVDPDVLLGRRPGGVFYRYTPEGRLVRAALTAVLRNGTRVFRDLDTGEEFRESGFYRWQVTVYTPRAASSWMRASLNHLRSCSAEAVRPLCC